MPKPTTKILSISDLHEKITEFDFDQYQKIICTNIQRIRKELYNNFKVTYNSSFNPYSIENIASTLGINIDYYMRMESPNNIKRPINLKNLLKIVLIFDRDIGEFLKK